MLQFYLTDGEWIQWKRPALSGPRAVSALPMLDVELVGAFFFRFGDYCVLTKMQEGRLAGQSVMSEVFYLLLTTYHAYYYYIGENMQKPSQQTIDKTLRH